jgi:uncharacterized membrane protein YtjA (UPF0391 family)
VGTDRASRPSRTAWPGSDAHTGSIAPHAGAPNETEEIPMLYYALVFFIVALVAAIFGFGGIAAGAVEIAKILFFVFLILFVVSLVFGVIRRSP